MIPVVVTVGPLAAASANNISTSQTPTSGRGLVLNGTLASKASQFTASASGNVLTVTALASGAVVPGQVLNGAGVIAGTVITGLGTGAGGTGTYIISPAQTTSSTTIYGDVVVTMDNPRQVLLTTTANETTRTFTIIGTDWAGNPITEVVTGVNNSTVASVLSYQKVISIVISGTAAGALTVGTNGVGYSPWVRLDGWANPVISKQCVITGTVNYTVQQSWDDPNSSTNPVSPSAMTWFNDPDFNFISQIGNASGTWSGAPVFARVLLNSGTGVVTATFQQLMAVSY